MNKRLVVILLGNRMNDDGTISDIQKERLEMLLKIDQEFDVYKYRKNHILFFCKCLGDF